VNLCVANDAIEAAGLYERPRLLGAPVFGIVPRARKRFDRASDDAPACGAFLDMRNLAQMLADVNGADVE
jgi:hypothetical protein